MRKFEFPLETALKWRQRQLEQEEMVMKQRVAELQAVELALQQLDAQRREADRHVHALPEVAGEDLEALARYREGAKLRELKLVDSRRTCEQRLEHQRLRMLEARRAVKLLEKLRERRVEAWQAEFDKEIENLATEVYLAQWPQTQGGS